MNYILFDNNGDVARQDTTPFDGAIELTDDQLHDALLRRVDEKRSEAYDSRGCSAYDYVDAVTKQSSVDPATKAAGDAQLAGVLASRLQVKADFPKPLPPAD